MRQQAQPIQKLPIESGMVLGGHAACHIVTRVVLPCPLPSPDTLSVPPVMAELDTDLYGGRSPLFSFLPVWLANTTKTSTAPTTTISPARRKLPRTCRNSTPRSLTTAKSPSVPQNQLNLRRNLPPSRNRFNSLQPPQNSSPLHHPPLSKFLPISSKPRTTTKSPRLEPMTTRT